MCAACGEEAGFFIESYDPHRKVPVYFHLCEEHLNECNDAVIKVMIKHGMKGLVH